MRSSRAWAHVRGFGLIREVSCARMCGHMLVINHGEKHSRVLELPEMVSGLLVMLVVLWQACFGGDVPVASRYVVGEKAVLYLLCGLVWFNTLVVMVHVVNRLCRKGHRAGRFLWLQLLTGLGTSVFFFGEMRDGHVWNPMGWSLLPGLLMGLFSFINLRSYWKDKHRRGGRGYRSNPATSFFTYMLSVVLLSTVMLVSPGATQHPISLEDAFFMSASATSITGLTTLNVAETFTAFGKLVLLVDIQVGALGVMTFTYFVLMMLGKRLAVRDSVSVSGFLDQQGESIVRPLLISVGGVTLIAEAIGAACLYFLWLGHQDIPQMELLGYAIFHSVSAFCNAGITLFPDNMATHYMSQAYAVQGVMMLLMFLGTLGFGVYLELMMRVRQRLSGKRVQRRWSTHSWLVVRVTLLVLLVGCVGMSLLGYLEPSQHAQNGAYSVWESLWNAVGRSAGFNLTDIGDYGVVYKLFLCVMMFVGGNPAGTGGGVYAPVVAICVLEVLRVLRGVQDVEIHNRRLARQTVDRALATVLLSVFWIGVTTLLVLLLEPALVVQKDGLLKVFFMEVSAFTTTGYDLGAVSELSRWSKLIVSLNMLFGRVGMFTFMLIFVRQKDPSPARFPETRLPLS